MNDTREFRERRPPRPVKRLLSVGAAVLFVAGFLVGILVDTAPGVLLFALGAILFAIRGYINTGDKATAGVLIFVALVAIGIQAIVFFLAP